MKYKVHFNTRQLIGQFSEVLELTLEQTGDIPFIRKEINKILKQKMQPVDGKPVTAREIYLVVLDEPNDIG